MNQFGWYALEVVVAVVLIMLLYPALCRMTFEIYFKERKKND